MKNTLITIITFFLLMISSVNVYSQSSYTRIEYQSTFLDNFHKPLKKARTQKTGYQKFDENNNVVEDGSFVNSVDGLDFRTNYGDTGSVTFKSYDSFNQLKQETQWEFINNKREFIASTTYYDYNDKKQIIKELKQSAFSKSPTSRTYYYFDKKIIIIDSVYNFYSNKKNGNFEGGRDTIIIDSLGRITENSRYLFNGDLTFKRVYLFDKYSFGKTELCYYNNVSKLFSVTEFIYNLDKKLLYDLLIIVGMNHVQRTKYLYNTDSLLQKVESYVNEELNTYTEYKYLRSN